MRRSERKAVLARVGLAVALAAGAGCVSDRPPAGPDMAVSGDRVTIGNFAFAPAELMVRTGTTVTWTNTDAVGHTVSADDGTSFDSGAFTQGMTFQVVAGPPGTYSYSCRIHPFMKATLVVTP